MLRISDVMSDCPATVQADDTLINAIKILCQNHVSGAPVVDSDRQVVGFISEPSLMDVLFDENSRSAPVHEYMTLDVHVIRPDDSIANAAMMFTLYGVRRLPVVKNGELVGIVTRRDLLRHALAGGGPLNDPLVELIPAVGEFA